MFASSSFSSGIISAAAYADQVYADRHSELEAQMHAESRNLGIDPVSPAVGALLCQQVAATGAKIILEIGTGLGLATLKMLAGAEAAGAADLLELTTIEIEENLKPHVEANLRKANLSARSLRTVYGDALQVLPRFERQKYDFAIIDGDPLQVLDYFEGALPLVRPGGTVLVLRALSPEHSFRILLEEVSASPQVLSSLNPVGDGVLSITKKH